MTRQLVAFIVFLFLFTPLTNVFAYDIAGKVKRADGSGVAGVTLVFRAVKPALLVPRPVQTSSAGAWSAKGFQDGQAYSATPTKQGFSFSPASLNFSATTSNLDFTATPPPPFTVSGRITNSLGNGVPGITIRFGSTGSVTAPANVQTDSAGNWNQTGFETGTQYTVNPTGQLLAFTPQGYFVSQTQSNVNFTAQFSVVGQVRTAGGGVFPGVTISFACVANCGSAAVPAPVTTGSSGFFGAHGFTLGPTWKAIPGRTGSIFQPDETIFTTATENLNFTAAP